METRTQTPGRTHTDRLKLFTENEKLAYFACEKWMRGNSGYVDRYRLEREGLQGVALAALWYATEVWDASRGKFSTVATMAVFSRLSHLLRAATTKRNGSGEAPEPVSLSTVIPGSEEATYLDRLQARGGDLVDAVLPSVVWQMVDALPPGQARAIRLHYGQDLTAEEAGQVMGVSRQCINTQVKKGLIKLRAQLTETALAA